MLTQTNFTKIKQNEADDNYFLVNLHEQQK